MQSLSFVLDEETLYGVSAQYTNEHRKEINGYKMMPKIRPKDAVTKTFSLDVSKNEYINFMMLGVDDRGCATSIQLITS